jgi:peptide/nickel transport system permease protein
LLPYVFRRILYSIPVVLIASLLTFWGMRIAFDPLERTKAQVRNSHLSAEQARKLLEAKKKELHLNETLVHQWWRWLTSFVHGNMGVSEINHNSVAGMIQHALWPTLQLVFWGTLVSLVFAIAIGIYSAVRQYSFGDHALTTLSYIGIAMPPFIFGLLSTAFLTTWVRDHFHLTHPLFFSVGMHTAGTSGLNADYFRHIALPVATLTVQGVAVWSRFLRSSMLDVMHADYIRTARAKGVPRRKVVFKHAFRNALIPFTTVVALDTGALIGGLIVTEFIFSINGMGSLFITALENNDAPVLLAWFVITAAAIIVFNLFADVMYGYLDPRIRVT